jgi:hypothetical protein
MITKRTITGFSEKAQRILVFHFIEQVYTTAHIIVDQTIMLINALAFVVVETEMEAVYVV